MSKNIKIILFVVIPLIAITVIVTVLYFNLSQKQEPEEEIIIRENRDIVSVNLDEDIIWDTDENEPAEGMENITADDIRLDQAQIKGGYIYFYSKENKLFGRIDLSEEDSKIEILIADMSNIQEFQVSADLNSLLYKNYNENIYYIYEFGSKNSIRLNDGIRTALWYSSGNNKIVGSYSKSNINNINIYNLDNGDREELINLFINRGFLLDITEDGNKIIYTRSESIIDYDESFDEEIGFESEPGYVIQDYFVCFDVESRENIWQRQDVSNGKFNSDGKLILLSKQGDGKFPLLSIFNTDNNQENDLNLGTYLYKAEFMHNSNIIYAKVEGSDIDYTSDTLWKYDINSEKHTKFTNLQDNIAYDISYIMVSEDDSRIYFINRYDKKLYTMDVN